MKPSGRPGPPATKVAPSSNAHVDQALHLLELRLAGQRSDADSIRERITDFGGLGRQPGCHHDLSHLGARNQHAGRCVAGLAGVAEAFLHALRDCILEVGVIQKNVGRLAAEFLRDPLHGGGGGHGHCNTSSGGSSERDHRHVRMRRNRSANRRPIAIHQIENTRRDAQLHGESARTDKRRAEPFHWA